MEYINQKGIATYIIDPVDYETGELIENFYFTFFYFLML